jgi:hypothetical protein
MSITRRENFDTIAAHLAENIVDVMSMATDRSNDRRVELVQRQVRHALALGFKAGLVVERVHPAHLFPAQAAWGVAQFDERKRNKFVRRLKMSNELTKPSRRTGGQ